MLKTISLLAMGCILALGGCLDRDLRPLNPCTVSGVTENVKIDNIENVDLLFMVDNSNSMAEEQTNLAMQFPTLISVLASGDVNADGEQDFPPVRSLQVGVISSDMGTGGFLVPTCTDSNFGDDGVLRTRGNTGRPGCMATYPSFLNFEPAGGGDPGAFATDVTCVAAMGTNGCGFEQQLDAILKAVTPSTSAITFSMGTVGHADGANAGFVRDDSLLTIIAVTDEDDCSAIDPDLFNPSSARYSGDLNLRCFQFPEAVHPVDRYVSGLLATREDPDLLIFAAITGVPPTIAPGGPCDPAAGTGCPAGTFCQDAGGGQGFCLANSGDDTSFATILSDPQMAEQIDPAMPTRLQPSCNEPGTGLAFPPRRIVEVARQLELRGSNGLVASVCRSDFRGALTGIIQKIADVLGNVCLPRALNRNAMGQVNCDVVEELPLEGDVTRCNQLADFGRTAEPIRIAENGAEVCRISQVPVSAGTLGAGIGWYYDDFSADVTMNCGETPQRISFTTGAEPRTGSTVRLECLQSVEDTAGMVGVGTTCLDDPAVCDEGNMRRDIIETFPMLLGCDTPLPDPSGTPAGTGTCQPRCTSNADCPGGYSCADVDLNGSFFCVNPTCQAG